MGGRRSTADSGEIPFISKNKQFCPVVRKRNPQSDFVNIRFCEAEYPLYPIAQMNPWRIEFDSIGHESKAIESIYCVTRYSQNKLRQFALG